MAMEVVLSWEVFMVGYRPGLLGGSSNLPARSPTPPPNNWQRNPCMLLAHKGAPAKQGEFQVPKVPRLL